VTFTVEKLRADITYTNTQHSDTQQRRRREEVSVLNMKEREEE
jgi:hypothetical protein